MNDPALVCRYAVDMRAAVAAVKTAVSSQRSDERGYLTPEEDDQLKAAWLYYWRLRLALAAQLEPLRSVRCLEPPVFFCGFAAALVLVEAARSLREVIHQRSKIRRVLNQGDVRWNLPERAYEMVQRSLLGARQIWHLFRARQAYAEVEHILRLLAIDPAWAGLQRELNRLLPHLSVSKRRLLRAHVKVKARRVASAIKRKGIGRVVYAVHEGVGRLVADVPTRSGHTPSLAMAAEAAVRDLLRPGDVVVNRKAHVLTNHLLPGFWPHAAFVVGDAGELGVGIEDGPLLVEAQADGVRVRPVSSALGCDCLTVLRPRLGPGDIEQARFRALEQVGKPYDFTFDFSRSDRMVCSEVVYRACAGLGACQFDTIRRVGRPTLSPEDLIALALTDQCFDILAVVAEEQGDLLHGEEAQRAVRATIETSPFFV